LKLMGIVKKVLGAL
uniref:Eumenine mastoparan-EM1 n=1 Tax=Eumenes micado TaxID=2597558 RepID=MAST1_EUMMI|nr:RecName: Full=Eumenine mastoparan-EM1; Short=EMP-EM1 [Eumenes micado]